MGPEKGSTAKPLSCWWQSPERNRSSLEDWSQGSLNAASRCSSVERLCFLVFFRSTWFRLWSLEFSSEPCSTLLVDPLCQGGRDPIQERFHLRTGGVLTAACSLQVRSDHEKQLEQVSVLCNQENSVNASTRTHTHTTRAHTHHACTHAYTCVHTWTRTRRCFGADDPFDSFFHRGDVEA